MKIFLGDKFYKYIKETDEVKIIRICKIKNENTFTYIDNNNKVSITKDTLLSEYTKLKPDATITFSIVNLNEGLKDVIVAIYRTKDLESGDNIPYAVCRQNIFDMFTNQVQKGKIMHVGVSVSKDTILDDTPFEMTLACNGIDYYNNVSVYMDDVLEEILKFVNQSKFDLVLTTLCNNVINNDVRGYCKKLKQLLTENDFMYDFLRGFDIHRMNFKMEYDNETFELDTNQRIVLEETIKTEMFKTYVFEYTKEIDIDKIQRSHIMISDKEKKLYIVAYDKGSYINRAYSQGIKDKRDAVALLKSRKNNK